MFTAKGGAAASPDVFAGARPHQPEVAFALPAAELRPLITTYYRVATRAPLIDYLHPEWGNIRFTTAGQWQVTRPGCTDPTPHRVGLFGPSDRTATVTSDGPAAMIGIGLTALGWDQLIGEPAQLHANRMIHPGGALGARLEALHAQVCASDGASDWAGIPALLDSHFLAQAAEAPPPDPLITLVQQQLIDGDIDHVADLAARVGLSERTLERLCKRAFGFSPKRLLRRQRFLRTLAEIGDRLDQPLSVLLDGSYYDQSHFIREFKTFMGMTPLAYLRSPRQMMRRAAAERLRTAGAIVQGLHRGD
jgi:AraC-like DNA-binding protein